MIGARRSARDLCVLSCVLWVAKVVAAMPRKQGISAGALARLSAAGGTVDRTGPGWPPERATRLPTEAELTQRHQLSRQTVRRAYQELGAAGIVERIRGRRTFPARRGQYRQSLNSIEEQHSLSIDTELQVIEPLSLIANAGAAVSTALSRTTILRLLDHAVPHPVAGAKQMVTAVAAPRDIAEQIDRHKGEPMLKIMRVHFDATTGLRSSG